MKIKTVRFVNPVHFSGQNSVFVDSVKHKADIQLKDGLILIKTKEGRILAIPLSNVVFLEYDSEKKSVKNEDK